MINASSSYEVKSNQINYIFKHIWKFKATPADIEVCIRIVDIYTSKISCFMDNPCINDFALTLLFTTYKTCNGGENFFSSQKLR